MSSLLAYFDLFEKIDWIDPKQCDWLTQYQTDILLEQQSLSHRLLSYCENFSAEVITNQWQNSTQLPLWAQKLITDHQYLLRDVVLLADHVPWALGRSFIPKLTAQQTGFDLSEQGETPLGFTLFQGNHIEREWLKVARIQHQQQTLVARMSRLLINQKPLVVMELFLPQSPVYLNLSQQD